MKEKEIIDGVREAFCLLRSIIRAHAWFISIMVHLLASHSIQHVQPSTSIY